MPTVPQGKQSRSPCNPKFQSWAKFTSSKAAKRKANSVNGVCNLSEAWNCSIRSTKVEPTAGKQLKYRACKVYLNSRGKVTMRSLIHRSRIPLTCSTLQQSQCRTIRWVKVEMAQLESKLSWVMSLEVVLEIATTPSMIPRFSPARNLEAQLPGWEANVDKARVPRRLLRLPTRLKP